MSTRYEAQMRFAHRRRLPPATSFGEALVAIIDARGLSYFRAATVLGVDHSYISRLINGERNPSLSLVDRMCEDYALTDEEAMHLYATADLLPPRFRDRIVALTGTTA